MPKQLTTSDFIRRAKAVHGDRFVYSESCYTNNLAKITIICKKHGPFEQRAAHHMSGHGCQKCKRLGIIDRRRDTTKSFIAKARAVHGDTYDYSKVRYSKSNTKVEVTCAIHGGFYVTPNNHIARRSGCPKCAGKSMTTPEFIDKSIQVHGDRFGYSNAKYTKIKNPITITCQKHGDFEQPAESHLLGRGCRQCWYESKSSAGENELAAWVESLGVQITRNDRNTIGLELDILAGNIGIEYNGCYWHSHKILKPRQHEFKRVAAERAGIRLITVWDFDWRDRRAIVKRLILNALNINPSARIGARQCVAIEIPSSLARKFYDYEHIQGQCRGAVINLGLKYDGKIVAAMSFTRGGTRRGKTQEWELARYATSMLVPGGASKLFAYFVRHHSPAVVWSYSDTQHFTGNLYPTLGFEHDGYLPPDYRVINPRTMKVWHKSAWQRRSIPKRLRELFINTEFDPDTDPRTEWQMHDVSRVLRIYDSGKIRWMWRATSGN